MHSLWTKEKKIATEQTFSGQTLTLRVEIQGRVQGVGYRWWTVGQARARALSGWVRNRADGSVEALFSGSPAAVEEMVAACRRGPARAQVSLVRVEPSTPPAQAGFELR